MGARQRRRALLGAREFIDRDAPIFIDFSAGAGMDLAAHPRLSFEMAPGYPGPPKGTATVIGGLTCMQASQGSLIAFRYPSYGAEAIELDFFTTGVNCPILSCGNGIDNFAPAQYYYESITTSSYLHVFTSSSFADIVKYSSTPHTPPMRKRLRVERSGSAVKYSINDAPGDTSAIAQVRSSGVTGTTPSVYNSLMPALGFRSGIVFPLGNNYVVSIKWEKII